MKISVNFFMAFVVAFSLIAPTVEAQTLKPVQLSFAKNPNGRGIQLSWVGEAGISYFIQYSTDMREWFTLNYYNYGIGSPINVVSDCPNPNQRCFWRVLSTDRTTVDPRREDFDGDGISNQDELNSGSNPLSAADSDLDNLPDDWETFFFDNLSAVSADSPVPGGGTAGQSQQNGNSPYGASSTLVPLPNIKVRSRYHSASNQSFKQYGSSGVANPRRFRREHILFNTSFNRFETYGPWFSRRTTGEAALDSTEDVNPITGSRSFIGQGRRESFERVDYDGTGNNYRTASERYLPLLTGSGWWQGILSYQYREPDGSTSSWEQSSVSPPIELFYLDSITSETPTTQIYSGQSSGGLSYNGIKTLSNEYTTTQFVNDVLAQNVDFSDWTYPAQWDIPLAIKHLAPQANFASYRESEYSLSFENFSKSIHLQWFEVFTPPDLEETIEDESILNSEWEPVYVKKSNRTQSTDVMTATRRHRALGENGYVSIVFPYVSSEFAINTETFNPENIHPSDVGELYQVTGNLDPSDEGLAYSHALVLHYRDCVDLQTKQIRADANFKLIYAGPSAPNMTWVFRGSNGPALNEQKLPPQQASTSVVQVSGLRGGIFQYELAQISNQTNPPVVYDLPPIMQVWLPVAAPDIAAHLNNDLDFFKNTWAPAYQNRLNIRLSRWFSWLQNRMRRYYQVRDFRLIAKALGWKGIQFGAQTPVGGPDQGEERATVAGFVTDATTRNVMLSAYVGRLMGLDQDTVIATLGGGRVTPAKRQAMQAGFDLFNGTTLQQVMLNRGFEMQEPNSWTQREWPSWENATLGPQLTPETIQLINYLLSL